MSEQAAEQEPEQQPVKKTGLLRSSALVSVMTMISRVLGLARDICFAIFLGDQKHADAFYVAFKIPQFLRRLFAEGAFSQAFVPVLSEYQTTKSREEIKALLNRVAGVLGSALLLVTALAVIFAPVVTVIFAPGFIGDTERFVLTSDLIRITYPYLFFISLAGFAGAILNTYGQFAVPAFTPVLLNISLITGAIWGARYFEIPVFALGWAVLAAGIIQLFFQLPFLARLGLLPVPMFDTRHEGVRRIMTLMVPALFGVSVSQINLLLDTVLASFLPAGSIAWLYYSDRLAELPLGVFAIAIATVILPSLSRRHAADNGEEFRQIMDWSIRMVLLIALPAMMALMILAEPILVTLFGYGDKLSEQGLLMSGLSLRAYALGLLAFMLIKVLAPGYYSRQDMKTPVKIGIQAMAANMVLNLLFVIPLYKYFDIGHVGLALATSCSAFLNAGLLYLGLKKQGIYQLQTGFGKHLLRMLIALAIMVVFLWLLKADMAYWQSLHWLQRGLQMVGLCLAGVAVYLSSLFLTGLRFSDLRSPSH